MGLIRINFNYLRFRNMVIVSMIIVFLLFSYVVIGDSVSQRYIEVDQDIWSFLKYVGVLFLGLLAWAALDMVSQVKRLVVQVNALNVSVKVNNTEVEQIKNDVAEIKSTLNSHDMRFRELERNQRN
jgi:hypothetical protein